MTIDEAEKVLEGQKTEVWTKTKEVTRLMKAGEMERATDLLSEMADAAEQIGLAIRRITPAIDGIVYCNGVGSEGLPEAAWLASSAAGWFQMRAYFMKKAIELRELTPKQLKKIKKMKPV